MDTQSKTLNAPPLLTEWMPESGRLMKGVKRGSLPEKSRFWGEGSFLSTFHCPLYTFLRIPHACSPTGPQHDSPCRSAIVSPRPDDVRPAEQEVPLAVLGGAEMPWLGALAVTAQAGLGDGKAFPWRGQEREGQPCPPHTHPGPQGRQAKEEPSFVRTCVQS